MQQRKAASFKEILDAELAEIVRQRSARGNATVVPEKGDVLQRARGAGLVGLAFSGGGIRSATFNLGVLQGLAKLRLLPSFDYLSTVSGGGYIGSWLCSWIKRAVGVEAVQRGLMPQRRLRADGREADEIRFLRSYSNYLTPRRGVLSTDTWTMVTTYARNLVLNLSILVLALAALLLLPHVMVTLYFYLNVAMQGPGGEDWLLRAAFFLLLIAIIVVSLNLSSPPTDANKPVVRQRFFFSASTILLFVIVPVLLAGWLSSAGLWLWLQRQDQFEPNFMQWALASGVLYALLWLIGSLVTFVMSAFVTPRSVQATAPIAVKQKSVREQSRLLWRVFKSIPGAFFAGMVHGVFLLALACMLYTWRGNPGTELYVASFGMSAVVLIYALTAVVHIGTVGRGFSEEAREWWSRLGAVLLLWSTSIAALVAIALCGPKLVEWVWRELPGWFSAALASGWLASSVGGALLGNRAPVDSKRAPLGHRALTAVAPYVFILGLLLLLAWSVSKLLPSAVQTLNDWFGDGSWWIWMNQMLGQGLWPIVGVLAVASGLSLLISWRLGINEFSLHAGYRNRLVRCYLGASNREREPNPFTGFDPADDTIALSDLVAENGYIGPYPIINTALNLVRGDQLAWQSRKAASFVFTPQYSGYDFSSRKHIDPGHLSDNGYRPAKEYGGGVTLGTAMAISGAAASPNMGYHSSPALAFLMTVFNVRLGWWLGNPRHNGKWRSNGPRLGVFYLLRELFGMTNDRSSHVYLSDGGHFENLGLYELVRRRCRFILVSDAGEDHAMKFGDLGSAVERIRADFGISININVSPIRPQGESLCGRWYCAVGRIAYSDVDEGAVDGVLVYVKSSFTGNEPADVEAYRARCPEFPHQTTADQWFDESQFESYRALGQHVTEVVLRDVEPMKQPTPEQVFAAVEQCWRESSTSAAN